MENSITKAEDNNLVAPWQESEEATIKEKYGKNLTSHEWNIFRAMSVKTQLNPMFGEIYATKYGSGPASIFVGKNGYLKRASEHPAFDGHSSKCIYDENGKLTGAVATVWRKDRGHPVVIEVDMDEYDQKQSVWKQKPKTMIKKVALSQALRESFPSEFNGTYDESENWNKEKKVERRIESMVEGTAECIADDFANKVLQNDEPPKMSAGDLEDWMKKMKEKKYWDSITEEEKEALRETRSFDYANALYEQCDNGIR